MAALSAVVFTMSWWLGLYLLARDPRKPVLVLAAIGLTSFAAVVALDAVRVTSAAHADLLSRIEIYLVAVPAIAWFAVLVELSRPCDSWRSRAGEALLIAIVAAGALAGAVMAGSVDGPLRAGHWVMFGVISLSTLGAMLAAVVRRSQPGPVAGFVIVATLFFALGNAILIIPLGLVPSWLALASTGFDVALLGLAVALWDAFDEGQALRADMLRSFAASGVLVVLFGGQALVGLAVVGPGGSGRTALTVLLGGARAQGASFRRHRPAQTTRRRRLRHHRRMALLQRALFPVRGRCARVRAERHRVGPRPGGSSGVAVVRHRGPTAIAAQLAERGRQADRGRSARPGTRHAGQLAGGMAWRIPRH